ncbi:Fic family protein [Thalassospira marina]|uniref:Cell filamentation protein Fic n=1 Tax=Thalassospira marina TaxID=2048283 RepID=A0A2N3KZX2_9PROT|nr:Fic family protein [Thalassospira marina]PKR56016.1 cell filamentation protein Fic [Thalassospira marina]
MNANLADLLKQVDHAKSRLAGFTPLPRHTASSLREKHHLDWIYHSNALAGNRLSLRETKVVLEGITIGGKSIAEHLEVIRHRDAIYHLEKMARQNRPLDAQGIVELHTILQTGRLSPRTSTTPDQDAKIADLVAQHRPPSGQHPLVDAARWHAHLINQRPFPGENGRLARLLLNHDLAQAGYLPAIIDSDDRQRYDAALARKETTPVTDELAVLIIQACLRTFNLTLGLIAPAAAKPV